MKFTMRLRTDGRWIGGFMCHADGLAEQLSDHVKPAAADWGDAIVCTRIDNRGGRKGETIIIEPEAR